jgi:hypothetical protein
VAPLPSIVERPLSRGKSEARRRTRALSLSRARSRRRRRAQVSLSAFAFLFSELVQYHQSRVSNINELERRRDERSRASKSLAAGMR